MDRLPTVRRVAADLMRVAGFLNRAVGASATSGRRCRDYFRQMDS